MPYQSYLNRKLIGPDGLYTKDPDTATAPTRGVAYDLLCRAKKNYFGRKPWSYVKGYVKEVKSIES